MKTNLKTKIQPILGAVSICALGFLLSSCGSSSVTNAPPIADYGDAPDGGDTGYPAGFAQGAQFPSLFASGGAHILDISAASMGPNITEENDANITNADLDDGIVSLFTTLAAIPPPTTMTINVTGTEDGNYYFNSLIDLNMDGKWGGATGANGESEWVVQNQPVTVSTGVVTPITSPPFAFTNGFFIPTHAWMRIALTKEQVPQDWDGSGEFSKGEIEDHVISMPIVDGKEVPMLTVECGGPYSFGAAASIQVSCDVVNLRSVAGNFTHTVEHTPNGGTVDVTNCLPAGPLAIGAAAKPGEIPNPNPNATVTIKCTATTGNTPDAWTFKATAIDPDSVPTEFGIDLGYPATGSARLGFNESQLIALAIIFGTFPPEFAVYKKGSGDFQPLDIDQNGKGIISTNDPNENVTVAFNCHFKGGYRGLYIKFIFSEMDELNAEKMCDPTDDSTTYNLSGSVSAPSELAIGTELELIPGPTYTKDIVIDNDDSTTHDVMLRTFLFDQFHYKIENLDLALNPNFNYNNPVPADVGLASSLTVNGGFDNNPQYAIGATFHGENLRVNVSGEINGATSLNYSTPDVTGTQITSYFGEAQNTDSSGATVFSRLDYYSVNAGSHTINQISPFPPAATFSDQGNNDLTIDFGTSQPLSNFSLSLKARFAISDEWLLITATGDDSMTVSNDELVGMGMRAESIVNAAAINQHGELWSNTTLSSTIAQPLGHQANSSLDNFIIGSGIRINF